MSPLPSKPSRILQVVAEHYAVRAEILQSPIRGGFSVALARHMAMALIRHFTSKSLVEIAYLFRRHHTVVMHACRRIALDHGPDFDLFKNRLESDFSPFAMSADGINRLTPFSLPTGPRYTPAPSTL